ncbi:MAG: DUF1538 domain-containing protein [Chloroflexi bacterium]|nr:DUF1538 domain-containing protein [Chloroflexota bacterium]
MSQSNESTKVEYKMKYTPKSVLSIVGPYFIDKLKDQVKAILPITLFLLIFQFAIFRILNLEEPIGIALGMCCVVIGLMFFIEGLRVGVMPLGENIGATMPAKARIWVILVVVCVLGTAANMAEPAISTLRILGEKISPQNAPLLFDYLNVRTELMLWMVSVGVGLGACHGILRIIKGWSLKFTLLPVLALAFIMTIIAAFDKNASSLIGVVWDAGGITTGTVTAPLLLALGVGMATALGRNKNGLAGFGIIALCSLWPIVVVLVMGIIHSWTGNFMTPEQGEALLAAKAANTDAAMAGNNVFSLIGQLFISAAQAILLLMAILLVVQLVILREKIRGIKRVVLGIAFALIGLLFFKIGLEWGLNPLGDQVGHNSIISFSNQGFESLLPGLSADGRYGLLWGKVVVILFGFIVGYGATLAEPALVALGLTVEDVTAGAFKKRLVMHTVGIGVGIGMVIGVAKILYGWPTMWVIGLSYVLAIALTFLSDEKYVNIGWDSGGVTTGDITSPVLIALGLGVATATGAPDGFLLIAMASIWPIIAVLAMGILVNRTTPFIRIRKTTRKKKQQADAVSL